ncbi:MULTISPECIES: hypothetical protein [unclassified Campylobacter]|uniref:hypothetical protein n=1 Tax=unclassified Campylobacter TaxID=2593542 RepID=UPI001476584C|nr:MULTISPECIES: hypothetical protein [unclassified Campylobacter]
MNKQSLEKKRQELIKKVKLLENIIIANAISDYMDDFNKTRDTKDKKRAKK